MLGRLKAEPCQDSPKDSPKKKPGQVSRLGAPCFKSSRCHGSNAGAFASQSCARAMSVARLAMSAGSSLSFSACRSRMLRSLASRIFSAGVCRRPGFTIGCGSWPSGIDIALLTAPMRAARRRGENLEGISCPKGRCAAADSAMDMRVSCRRTKNGGRFAERASCSRHSHSARKTAKARGPSRVDPLIRHGSSSVPACERLQSRTS